MAELDDETALEQERIRQVGGGRKSALETIDGLDKAFLRVLEQHTAGSLTDETLKWTNLIPCPFNRATDYSIRWVAVCSFRNSKLKTRFG
ncbi:MAG: hypothetical protein EDM05_61230 [Leptolyngbya sp. IPPAS B-1204]|nr:hypothetical protein [Elainella sp. C42_A2020_010]RNJ65375.1 MAG: hypothetical protein EDM05_31380 [Leptolyngbya sp. IPPAS B-1204]